MKKIWTTLKDKWVEYFLEMIVIALSIFAGLELENWNERRKDEATKYEYYDLILRDIDADIMSIESVISELEADLKRTQEYGQKVNEPGITKTEIVEYMARLDFDYTGITFNNNTFETLRSTGDLKLLPPEIQAQLLSIDRVQKAIYDMSNVNDANWQNMHVEAEQEGFVLLEDWSHLPKRLREELLTGILDDVIIKAETSILWKEWNDQVKLSLYQVLLEELNILKNLIKN